MRVLFLLAFLFSVPCWSQDDSLFSIKVHFLYGSKPAKGYKDTEQKWFGGIHGGHVSIELDSQVIGFVPYGGFHIFSHQRKKLSSFVVESLGTWVQDTQSLQYLSIRIPLSKFQYDSICKLHRQWLSETPFDYAFIGMRCASATYEVLSRTGLVPYYSRRSNVMKHFYPKPLRKKMIRLAREKGYECHYHQGRSSRKWERD